MIVRCLGWPAPHPVPIILKPDATGDGRISDGICPACDHVLALLDVPCSPRVARFVARRDANKHLQMEKLR